MKTSMDYSRADQWIVGENQFDRSSLGKGEAVLSLGNGYLGLRSATEEGYLHEKRGLFVAGSFNCCDDSEVTELPNGPDVTGMEFTLNGQRFSLDQGEIKEYDRALHLDTGELTRRISWISPAGDGYELEFSRFVSRQRLPLIGQKVTITALNADMELTVRSGINGQMTNSGAQHFREIGKRSYDRRYLQYTAETTESKILFVISTAHRIVKAGCPKEMQQPVLSMARRKVFSDYTLSLKKGQSVTLEKLSGVHMSRDKLLEGKTLTQIQEDSLAFIREAESFGYDRLFEESREIWRKEWEEKGIVLDSEDPFDQLTIRFAQYHLSIMTPSHDSRMSVGAKGLSGEGYKGHTFWDCDQFVLPYFTFTFPEKSRSLEIYRYRTLPGARRKAAAGGFEGAQFPWESAWIADGEVTPAQGDADLITGLPQTIWTGKIEQHITADVAFGVWQYYEATKDEAFLEQYGYEIILDTARFWCSRLEEDPDGSLHIRDVIGPDEYKEHVDDNAYTNYMAWWNMKKALECMEILKNEKPELYRRLEEPLALEKLSGRLADCISRMYLPSPDEQGRIPQDATYLTLQDIDLSKYKAQNYVLGIYKDYNAEQLNHIQVSKQADVMILFYLLEHLFDMETKRINWDYYEPRTLHDSSLSLSTHCILAADLGERERAYEFFQKASRIDLGPQMHSSDDGIHSASIGGIWQCVVFAMAGVRLTEGKLRICPQLPKKIHRICFPFCYQGELLKITVDKSRIVIENRTKGETHEYFHSYRND